jgi:hypothetical protein
VIGLVIVAAIALFTLYVSIVFRAAGSPPPRALLASSAIAGLIALVAPATYLAGALAIVAVSLTVSALERR